MQVSKDGGSTGENRGLTIILVFMKSILDFVDETRHDAGRELWSWCEYEAGQLGSSTHQ